MSFHRVHYFTQTPEGVAINSMDMQQHLQPAPVVLTNFRCPSCGRQILSHVETEARYIHRYVSEGAGELCETELIEYKRNG